MDFLHSDYHGGPDHVAMVTLDGQANVMLLDDCNFNAYRRGGAYRYTGGLAKQSPVRLSPPHEGHWHIVVDLGGYAGQVRAGVHILRGGGVLC